jgi:hypothetical protein
VMNTAMVGALALFYHGSLLQRCFQHLQLRLCYSCFSIEIMNRILQSAPLNCAPSFKVSPPFLFAGSLHGALIWLPMCIEDKLKGILVGSSGWTLWEIRAKTWVQTIRLTLSESHDILECNPK